MLYIYKIVNNLVNILKLDIFQKIRKTAIYPKKLFNYDKPKNKYQKKPH